MNSMEQRPSWKRKIVTQLVKKFPAFYGTRKFITVVTKPGTGPYPDPDASSPNLPILFPKDIFKC
jgi:hypothetical protein